MPRATTAISVVPPPMSTIIVPMDSVIGRRAPIAAVIGCTAFEAGDNKQPFVIDFDIGVAEVKGTPGQGTTVTVRVPFDDPKA